MSLSGMTVTHHTCRSCGTAGLQPILSLGNHFVSTFVTDDAAQTDRAPLELVLCSPAAGGCGLLQLRHSVNQASLYRNYWYRSGVNQTMRDALRDITSTVEKLVPLQAGDMVIDTGSNDNTLLNSYETASLTKIGFEPALNLATYQHNADVHVIPNFFAHEPLAAAVPGRKARVITSIAMFYDLEDPNQFVGDVARSLTPDGLWIIQMSYLPLMLEQTIFDNICHEHLEYYSLQSLEPLLNRHGLKVVDVTLNDVNGGSFRIFVTPSHNTSFDSHPAARERLTQLRAREAEMHLALVTPYRAFAARVEKIKQHVTSFIHEAIRAGKRVDVYGASTKGNTLLQYFGLDHTLISAAAERNPDKWGKKTVGTLIPIIAEDDARAQHPDYFLVLPWHFLQEFVVREQAYLKSGGQFIVPLPQFRIVGAAQLPEFTAAAGAPAVAQNANATAVKTTPQ